MNSETIGIIVENSEMLDRLIQLRSDYEFTTLSVNDEMQLHKLLSDVICFLNTKVKGGV